MTLLKLKTNKLFYGKWPYKVTCSINNASYLRTKTTNFIKNSPDYVRLSMYSKSTVSLINLKKFVSEAEEFLNDPAIKTRVEYKNIDFYIQDTVTFHYIQSKLKEYVTKISEPANENDLAILLENKKYNICNNFPYGKFRYKITFKDMPDHIRLNLINWAEKYSENDIHINKSTRIHFKGLKYKFGPHYFYVRDQQLVTMISIASSGYIRKTEEYVLRTAA